MKDYLEKKVYRCTLTKEYIKAFVMGNKKEIDINYTKKYQSLGVSHLFAISGMHISLISGLLLFILSKFKSKYVLTSLFLIFYIFLTGFSASVLRSSLIFIIYSFFKMIKIEIKSIYIVIFLFSIFLLVNPFYIYDIGFKFSFLVSYSILFFQKEIENKKGYFRKTLFISFLSFIISMPIVINNFYQINILSVLFNLVYVPFISFIIFPLGLLTYFLPICDMILNFLEYITDLFSNIPSTLYMAKIPLILVVIYHIFVIYYFKRSSRIKTLILILFIIIFYNFNRVVMPTITFIDVGQGDSSLLRIHDKNILIDTGGKVSFKKEETWSERNNDSSLCNNVLLPYLKSNGVKKLDYLILTHGDFDHMGEAINLVNNFKVEKVIFNCGEYNDLESELIKVLDKKDIKYYSCIEELNIDNNKLYFLNTKEYDNENDNSVVIHTKLNNYKFLFMGDASILTEKEILDKYNLTNIDVLKVGHHGSKTSSSKEFVDTINHKYSIISVGKNNRYGHPNNEVLNNLEDSKVYRTDQDGSIKFKIKKDKLEIETCKP